MGFDTYLEIDNRIILMWRKHASSLPRFLFRHSQIKVSEEQREGGEPISVVFSATVREVLENLDEAGLGWNATVAAYSEIRNQGHGGAMLLFADRKLDEVPEEEANRAIDEFRLLPPSVDLESLGSFLADRWNDPDVIEPEILTEISYDGDIPSPFQLTWGVYQAAKEMQGVNEYATHRATESWCGLYHEARLLAWPMLMCIFLRALRPDSVVTFDVSEDAYDQGVRTIQEGHTYADEYWESTTRELASFADSLGRLFSALAAFDSKLGRDFWFARAADLYAQLSLLAANRNDKNLATKTYGDALESLFDALVRTEQPELLVIEKNYRTREEEIDILLTNGLSDPFWISYGSPLILIECKNRTEKAGVPDLRVFESKISDRGAVCKIGIFVSTSGFTSTFLQRLKNFQANGGVIFAVNGDDLKELISTKTRLTDWLRGVGLQRSLGR